MTGGDLTSPELFEQEVAEAAQAENEAAEQAAPEPEPEPEAPSE